MAASGDFVYLGRLLDDGVVGGRVLELGRYNRQGSEWGNFRVLVDQRGLSWQGADIEAGPGVDFCLDVLDADAVARVQTRWDTVLVPNLLEHVFDPIRALSVRASAAPPELGRGVLERDRLLGSRRAD